MANYWKVKTFKTQTALNAWVKSNQSKYQIVEIFINNSFGVEYKSLIKL